MINLLRRTFERILAALTGTALVEFALPAEDSQRLEKVERLAGVSTSTYLRVITVQHLIKKGVLDESVASDPDVSP